jgi:cytochrome c oxidase cbb3-type subunit III
MRKIFISRFICFLGTGLFLSPLRGLSQATVPAETGSGALTFEWMLGIAIAGLLLLLLVSGLMVVFVQMLPFLKKFYDQPVRRDTLMGRFIGLFYRDARLFTGKSSDFLMEDHSYDGIQEYDNDLPPWWKYMFYATIAFSVVYLLHFHVFQSGQLQAQEYESEMQEAALFLPKTDGGNANEKTDFKVLTDAGKLESGHALYTQNCAACHGQSAEGMVGPNLVDEYWLHGGDVNAVFKTIKFGITSKGMVAWQGKLSDDQILEISSYILSLQGTNPPNAKAPQGEKAK